MCGTGPVIVLPNKFADEIRNEPLLEFAKGIREVSSHHSTSNHVGF